MKKDRLQLAFWVVLMVLGMVANVFGKEPSVSYSLTAERPVITDDDPHYLVWHYGNLWHIRWQSPEKKARFSGTLRAVDGSISLEERVNLERKDKVKKEDDTISFKGKVKEEPEGFDFTWSGRKLILDLYIEGDHLPTKVYIGKRAIRPTGVPFSVTGAPSASYVNISSGVASGIPEVTTKKPHYLFWHTGDVWHLRWQSLEKKERFSGTIKAIKGSIELCRRVNLEKKDKTKVTPPNLLTFKGKVKEEPEGFDFRWTGEKLMLDLRISGEPSLSGIYIGRRAINPSKLPFYIVPGRYVLPFPPRHRRVNRPMPREIPPPFRHIPPSY